MYSLYRIKKEGPLHIIQNNSNNNCYYLSENNTGNTGAHNPENWWKADIKSETITFVANFDSVHDIQAFFKIKQLLGVASDQNT